MQWISFNKQSPNDEQDIVLLCNKEKGTFYAGQIRRGIIGYDSIRYYNGMQKYVCIKEANTIFTHWSPVTLPENEVQL